jgi:diguanylate cyclase (GGDEF)-like protein
MVSYVAPVYKNGQLIGVVGMDIQLSLLLNAVAQIAPYENGFAYLISQTGEELYHPYEPTHPKGEGHEIVSAEAPLDNGMTLVVCAYSHDVQAEGYKMLTAMIAISFGIVGIFIIAAIVMTQRIVNPLRRLASITKSIGEAPALKKWKFDTKDEVGVLYGALEEANRRLYEHLSDVRAQAYRDSLTGLRNFTSYKEAVEKLKKKIEDGSAQFGVAVFDLNNLKTVNDRYGHEGGNELLMRVSTMIAGVFRRSKAYRVGGDEFIVLIENEDYDEYDKLLASFDAICSEEHLSIEDDFVSISVAWGVALYDENIDSSYENVFHRADGFMYRNKRHMKGIEE